MTKPTISRERFDARREGANAPIRAIVDFLITAAAHAGPDVGEPVAELKGEGLKFRSGNRQFCVVHLRAERVWVKLAHGPADRDALVSGLLDAGLEHTRSETDGPWIPVTTLQQAVRLVPFIVAAHDRGKGSRGPESSPGAAIDGQ